MALLIPLSKLPLALDASVERVEPGTGLPTTATLDAEFALSEWTKRNVVETERRTTLVENSTGTISGRVEDIAEVIQNPDGSLTAQRLTNVSTTANNASGKASDALSVVQNPDGSVTAGKLTDLTTTVGLNTASLITLGQSVDGLSVRYAVVGNINGSTGGFELTGIQRADGSGATYTFDIYANTRIYGNLLVTGTVDNPQLATNAATNGAGTTSAGATKPDASVTLTVRANARVVLTAVYVPGNFAVTNPSTTVDGSLFFEHTISGAGGPTSLGSVGLGYRAVDSAGGSGAFRFRPDLTVNHTTTVLAAGTYTFRAGTNGSSTNVQGSVTLTVIELSR